MVIYIERVKKFSLFTRIGSVAHPAINHAPRIMRTNADIFRVNVRLSTSSFNILGIKELSKTVNNNTRKGSVDGTAATNEIDSTDTAI